MKYFHNKNENIKSVKSKKAKSLILNVSLLWAKKNVDFKILSIILLCIKDKSYYDFYCTTII